jgi:type I restriction enzyme, S subunit
VRSLRSSLSSWNTGRIGDLPITIIDGDRSAKYPKRDEFQSEGILFLNTTNIVDDRFDLHSANFVSLEKYDSISKGRLQPLDIVMTTRGTIGKVALYDRPDPGLVNAQMLILRADGEIVDPKFLFHMIRSDEFQSKLRNFSSGSAQPQIPITDLRAVTISLPDIHSQRSIAEILSAYDNLIENNTRRIKILEQIAQMLYREWFVDFRFPG